MKINLFESLVLNVDGEKTIIHNFPELWEAFGWDIQNDSNADECAKMVTRELICFGFIDLSALTNGAHDVSVAVK